MEEFYSNECYSIRTKDNVTSTLVDKRFYYFCLNTGFVEKEEILVSVSYDKEFMPNQIVKTHIIYVDNLDIPASDYDIDEKFYESLPF